MQLIKNSKIVLREIAKVSPDKFEATQVERKKMVENLDSLQKSQLFFTKEYKGSEKQKAESLKQIAIEIDKVLMRLQQLPERKSIGELERYNASDLEDSLILILNDLRLFFQVDNMISTDGLYSLCDLILTEYRSLTLEEIAICMAKAKKGEYGQLFNRLDGAIIMGWLKKYDEERLQRIANRNYVERANYKIGLNEGRQTFKGNNAHLINEAHALVALERAKKP